MILNTTFIISELRARASVTTIVTAALCRIRALVVDFIRNRGQGRLRAFIAGALLFALPFLLVGSCNSLSVATLGTVTGSRLLRDNPVLAHMSEKEQGRYARMLADLVGDDSRTFLKMVGADVKLLLDEPDLARADGPMAVWQYRSENCVLDVFLALQDDSKTKRVVDYEVRSREKARFGKDTISAIADDAACFHSVLAAAAAKNSVILASLN